jgi:hypothetical protein
MWTCNAIGGYQYNGGTSMAAPVVAGVAALVKSKYPQYSAKQVALLLKRTADDIQAVNSSSYADKLGSGRVNLARALSEAPSGILFENIEITDGNDESYQAGDTLKISGVFKNYLASASGVTVQLEAANNVLSPLQSSFNIGQLNSLDSVNNRNSPFVFVVPSGLSFNQRVDFNLRIRTNALSARQHFSTLINADFITLKENKLTVTYTSDGGLGFSGPNSNLGSGYIFESGNSLLYEGSFALAFSPQEVADKFRAVGSTDQDFRKLQLVTKETSQVPKVEIRSTFSYPSQGHSKVEVNQRSFVFNDDSLASTVIHTYEVKNTSGQTLSNLYAGLLTDWDVVNWQKNKIGYDASRQMGISFSTDSAIYCGVRLLDQTTKSNHYAIDNTSSGNGGLAIGNGFSDSLKYLSLSTQRDSAGINSAEGNDVLDVNSMGPFSLQADSSKLISFAICMGKDLNSLQEYSDSANSTFNRIILNLLKQPKVESKPLLMVYPNPVNELLNVQLNVPENESYNLNIFDIQGKLIHQLDQQSISKGQNNFSIDVSSWKTGVYFFSIQSENLKIQNKFVVSP